MSNTFSPYMNDKLVKESVEATKLRYEFHKIEFELSNEVGLRL